jgi:hypothetical protein
VPALQVGGPQGGAEEAGPEGHLEQGGGPQGDVVEVLAAGDAEHGDDHDGGHHEGDEEAEDGVAHPPAHRGVVGGDGRLPGGRRRVSPHAGQAPEVASRSSSAPRRPARVRRSLRVQPWGTENPSAWTAHRS